MKRMFTKKRIVIGLVITEVALQIISFGRFVYYTYQARRQASNWYILNPENRWITNQDAKMISQYHPLLAWTYAPISTPNIHIDNGMVRRTLGNPKENIADIPSLYFFGGSTMWGAFAKDGETIPSYFSREINAGGPAIRAINYGHVAYNSNQELALFVNLLKGNKIPDYVIFYDGCNDFKTAPDLVYGQTRMREYLGNMDPILFPVISLENKSLLNHRLVVNAIAFIGSHIKIVHYPMQAVPRLWQWITTDNATKEKPLSQEELAQTVAENYSRNAAVIDVLSRVYGFRYLLLWQPLAYDKVLTKTERMFPNIEHEAKPTYELTKQRVRENNISNFVDLSDIFIASAGASVFIDDCHVTPEANRVIGVRIAQLFRDKMR